MKYYWYNPLKKYPMISFINSDKTVYYTRSQILMKDLDYILYYSRKNILKIITFIITIISIFISIYPNETKILINNLFN